MRPAELGAPGVPAVLVETSAHGVPGLHWCEVVEVIASEGLVRIRTDAGTAIVPRVLVRDQSG